MKIPLPTKAKITALVCRGRILPKVVKGVLKFMKGQTNCTATRSPTDMPTIPQKIVAIPKFLTILLS